MCAPLLILFGAHTTADMRIIPKFALFFSGWWIEIAGVGIYWALLGQGKRLSCDFVPSQFTWRVEAGVRVRLGFYDIQLYFQYFQCSSPHHCLVPSYPQNHTCGMLAHFSCLWLLCNKSQFSVWMRKSLSLRCMRKGSTESVMLEVFELCLLTFVYSEDLVSEKTSAAECISISFIYVSASENSNTIIKLVEST